MRKVDAVEVVVVVVVGLSISYFIYLLCLDDTMKVSTSKKKKTVARQLWLRPPVPRSDRGQPRMAVIHATS